MRFSSILFLVICSVFTIQCQPTGDSSIEPLVFAEEGDSSTSLLQEESDSADSPVVCLPAVDSCAETDERVSFFDDDGCETIQCRPQPKEAKLPEPPVLRPPPPPQPNEAVCRIYIYAEGRYMDLKPSDGYITNYVPLLSGYRPSKGRYAPGTQMYCERQYINCSSRGEPVGKIGGMLLQARLIADRDQKKCDEPTFVGHPEYTYKQYKSWYQDIHDKYQLCKNRAPTPAETKAAIDRLLEDGESIYSVFTSICQ